MAFPFPKNQDIIKSILRDWIFSSAWLLERGHVKRAAEEYREATELSLLLPGGSYSIELQALETLYNKFNDVYSQNLEIGSVHESELFVRSGMFSQRDWT